MALCVFSVMFFESFNYFGFLFCWCFSFFMSGYGMEKSNKRDIGFEKAWFLTLGYFLWFSLIYFLFFPGVALSFFLVPCCLFCGHVIYRFISNVYGLLWAFVLLACVFYCLRL